MKQDGKCPSLHTTQHMSQGEYLACGSLKAKQNKTEQINAEVKIPAFLSSQFLQMHLDTHGRLKSSCQ